MSDHATLLKQVKTLRRHHSYWDEFKWASLRSSNFAATCDLIDLLLASDAHFSCFVSDRQSADPVVRFGNTFAAYEKLATQLLIGSVQPYELVSVVADNYSAPNNRSFENAVRLDCNKRLNRLAAVSVLQVDSAATEGLQLVDVLLGAVAFGFKADAGLASHASRKGQGAAFLRARLGVNDFSNGHSLATFKVRLYEHQRWLTQTTSTS